MNEYKVSMFNMSTSQMDLLEVFAGCYAIRDGVLHFYVRWGDELPIQSFADGAWQMVYKVEEAN